MISNNITTKLKASKSLRDYRDDKSDDQSTVNSDDTSDTTPENKDGKDSNHVKVMVFSPKTKVRGLLEFRPNRELGSDRRSRGKIPYNNNTRAAVPSGRRFQEPLKDATYPQPKQDFNLPEDPRISKMLRKLCAETDRDRSIAICYKLLDTLMLPDNAKYVRRAFDILAESLLEVILFGPCDETKFLASRALGRIGYILENDFAYFLTWLIKEFTKDRYDQVKILLIKSLIETFTLEQEQMKLMDFSTMTLNNIITQLEYAERPELFMALIDVALLITECYPEINSYFRDIVDILVGWLIESKHSPEMADYASRSLQRLGVHWQTNMLFSIQLLGQFLEDLVLFGEALTQSSSGTSTPLEYISPY